MKRTLLFCMVLSALCGSAQAAMTYGGDYYLPRRGGIGAGGLGDPVYQFINEMETDWEASTLDGGTTLTFSTNGGTFDNATNNAFEWNENSEDYIWTFTSDTLTVTSSTGVVTHDFALIVPMADQILLDPVSAAVGTVEGTMYYDSDDDIIYGRNSSSWVSLMAGAGSPAGANTQLQYNDSGSFGGIATIVWDDTNLEFADEQALAWGTSAEITAVYDDDIDDQFLISTTVTGATAITDPLFEFLVPTSPTADQQVFGVAKGSQATNTALFTVDEDGDGEFAGSLTLGSTFYQTAIVSAAAGNIALTVNASGSGAVTIGGISTGNVIIGDGGGIFTVLGSSDIGDTLASDTLSVLAKVDTDLVIDDDTTNSPALVLRDAGENDWQFVKVNGAGGNLTATSDAATSDFQIVTGNLKVGGGSEGVTLNGEDAYITGTLEVDAAAQFDGTVTVNDDTVFTDQILVTLADNDEEITVTGTATNMTAAAQLTLTLAAQDATKHILRLIQTPDADAENEFLLLEDNAGDDKFEIEEGGNTIWTLDAAAMLRVNAATTTNTSTAGVIDLDVTSATASNRAIYIDYELDDGGSGTQYGIYIDLDDDGAGGDETFHAVSLLNSAGTNATTIGVNVAVEIDTGINIVTPAAGQAIVIDASAAHTETGGVIDIGLTSATTAAAAITIDLEVDDLGAGESVAGLFIDTDDDTSSNSAFVRAIHLNASDVAGEAGTINQAIYAAGFDAALQADNGYVRIGTGATPGVTPGDDDLFVEGTAEIDTYVRTPYFVVDSNSVALSEIHVDTVEIINSEIKGLRASPHQLIAAPGANNFVEVISVVLILDFGSEVLTEGADNLVVEYNTSGTDITGAIEAGGFIDAAADTVAVYYPAEQAGTASGNFVNRAVQLFNTGGDEYAGNASNDTRMTVKINYRIHADGL